MTSSRHETVMEKSVEALWGCATVDGVNDRHARRGRHPAVASPVPGGLARVVVVGVLDSHAADRLEEIYSRSDAGEVSRVELDLSGVTDTTPEGVAAVTRCLAMRQRFPDGVGVLVANDVGRRALLDSLSGV
jgi:hypothetical protein